MMTLTEKMYMNSIHKSPLSRMVYFISEEEARRVTRLACEELRKLRKNFSV